MNLPELPTLTYEPKTGHAAICTKEQMREYGKACYLQALDDALSEKTLLPMIEKAVQKGAAAGYAKGLEDVAKVCEAASDKDGVIACDDLLKDIRALKESK